MWRYDQRTGELWDGDQYVARGYSGLGDHKNKPEDQTIKGEGPIPRGQYHIGPPYDSPNVGPYALALEALPGTETYGRGDFKIHGDSQQHPGAASHGCIIMPRAVREQVGAVRGTLEVFTT